MNFNAETYWRDIERKKWVVEITATRGLRTYRDTKYVAAKTREGAEDCALRETLLEGARVASTRLATPEDLGCERREAA